MNQSISLKTWESIRFSTWGKSVVPFIFVPAVNEKTYYPYILSANVTKVNTTIPRNLLLVLKKLT